MPDYAAITSLRLMTEGGRRVVPADSGLGGLYRPFASGQPGARTATLETLWDFWINNVPDPSEALAMDPDLRTKLRMHADVVSALRKREKTVSSFPWRIEPNPLAKDRDTAKQVAEYASGVWQQLPSPKKLYEQMQQGILEGGIGVEWVWHREATGVERPAKFWAVHKSRFLFDRLGNMCLRTREEPVWGAYVATAAAEAPDGEKLWKGAPPGKFMYHLYRQEPGTWERPDLEGYQYYGAGEEIPLYYPVTFDVFVLRGRMKWLEKFGDPPTDIYYPENQAGVRDQLRKIASSVRGESVVTIPRIVGKDGVEHLYAIRQREVPSMSYDAFERFSDGYAKRRIDAILLGDADETQKGEGGAYSDKVARREGGPDIWFRSDAQDISDTINSQLMPALVRARFPNLPDEYVPLHKLEPKEERDRQQEAEILKTATGFVPVAEAEAYERLGFRKPNPGEPTVGGPGSPMDPAVQQQAAATGEADGGDKGEPGGKPAPGDEGRPASIGKGGGLPTKPKAGIGGGPAAGAGAVAKVATKPQATPKLEG